MLEERLYILSGVDIKGLARTIDNSAYKAYQACYSNQLSDL